MSYKPTTEEYQRAIRYAHNIHSFIKDELCREHINQEDFIPGSQRIEFYAQSLKDEHFFDILDTNDSHLGGSSYEESIVHRVLERTEFSSLALLGGLGSGKTTAIRHVLHLLNQRRDHFRITKCSAACPRCQRHPIYVNCIHIDRDSSAEDALLEVTQLIRTKIYEQLLTEWLGAHGAKPNLFDNLHATQLVRYLIIVNDLASWTHSQRPASLNYLSTPIELHSEKPILELEPSQETIESLVKEFGDHMPALDPTLARVHYHKKDNIDFTSALLGFYLSKCPPQNPQNMLIVDNLDQLPTRHIEDIARAIHSIASANPYFQVILPLRPSSVLPAGFIRNMEVWYHYGPNNFDMILHRLFNQVLNRPRNELARAQQKNNLIKSPFAQQPSGEELDFFLLAVYLYAQILSSSKHTQIPPENLNIHKSHKFLKNLLISERARENISNTIWALVGTCSRYANELVSRYFNNIYYNPEVIFSALKRGIKSDASTKMTVPFKTLVNTIIFDGSGSSVSQRIANLYLPTKRSAAERYPTLAKVRILRYLQHWKRTTVGEIAGYLSNYGIPAEISIQALNSLHQKERLLLWFSDNHELRSLDEDAGQYVVISEHGLSYLKYVLGDFEYIWACAAQISGQKLRESSFNIRLSEYINLISNFGATEWKQIAFKRCLGNYIPSGFGYSEHGNLITLELLYSSLVRALTSAEPLLKKYSREHDEFKKVANETQLLIEKICILISVWEERYRLCYGGTGYLDRYSGQIRKVKVAIKRIQKIIVFPETTSSLVKDLARGWLKEAEDLFESRISMSGALSAADDVVSKASKYLRAFLPFPKEWLAATDNNIALKIHVDRFQESEAWLGYLLSSSLPSFRQVEDALRQLERNIAPLIHLSETIGAATGTTFYKRLLQERDRLQEKIRELEQYQIPESKPCTSSKMSERKLKFNRVMLIYQELGSIYCEHELNHLKISWH